MKKHKLLISVLSVILVIALFLTLSLLTKGEPADNQGASGDEAVQQTAAVEEFSSEEESKVLLSQQETESETQSATKATEAESAPKENTGKLLNVGVINQHPELPTGCEVTSLTMLLNYYGVYADKCDIADNYLEKGEVGTVDFRQAFEGDPRDPNSYGCYAPVIVDAANSYLSAYGSAYQAVEISGQELEALFSYIDNGAPVIVWGTLDCREGYYSTIWTVDGRDIQWITPEHCMVLTGYDEDSVTVADPFYGEVRTFDKEEFRIAYNMLYRQAVVLI